MSDAPPALLHFVARLHVVLVHFPIALVIAACVVEFVRLRAVPQRGRSPAASLCLALGASGALAAAASGWLLAGFDPPGRALQDTLLYHRWTGVAAVVVSFAALGLGYLQAASVSTALFHAYRGTLLVAALLVSIAGHFGGEMVHGDGYLFGVFASGRDAATGNGAPGGPDASGTPADAPSGGGDGGTDVAPGGSSDHAAMPVDYATQVRPLLEARCVECHGPDKVRGKLRLDDMALTFDPAREDRWVIRPGAPEQSELVRRVTLPADDEDVMPAKGEPLTADQVDLLRRWIAQGAPWPGQGDGSR